MKKEAQVNDTAPIVHSRARLFITIAVSLACELLWGSLSTLVAAQSPGCASYEFLNSWRPGARVVGVAVDATGNVFATTNSNPDAVHKFTNAGVPVTSWSLSDPFGVVVTPAGDVLVSQFYSSVQVRKFDELGNSLGDFGNSQFNNPYGLAIDTDGNVYVADSGNHRIQKFDSNGGYLASWGIRGSAPGQFDEPYGVAVDTNNVVFVADYFNNRIQKFDSSGNFLGMWGSEGGEPGQFAGPHGVAVDGAGNVFVADFVNHRIQKFTNDGEFVTAFGGYPSMHGVSGVAVDIDGNVFVASNNNGYILKFRCADGVCGNGDVEGSEECDDRGTADGDGCSHTCTTESGWSCGGEPSQCTDGVCSDGELCFWSGVNETTGVPAGSFLDWCPSSGPSSGCDDDGNYSNNVYQSIGTEDQFHNTITYVWNRRPQHLVLFDEFDQQGQCACLAPGQQENLQRFLYGVFNNRASSHRLYDAASLPACCATPPTWCDPGNDDECISERRGSDDVCLVDDGVTFQPDFWNDDNGCVQMNNNCYNYSMNRAEGNVAQPGVGAAGTCNLQQTTPMTCGEYEARAVADGLVSTSCDVECPSHQRKIALVVAPGVDYHWYRKDSNSNGNWSHKPGSGPATNLDASGQPIGDPRSADRNNPAVDTDYDGVADLHLNYSEFCQCFCTQAACDETLGGCGVRLDGCS